MKKKFEKPVLQRPRTKPVKKNCVKNNISILGNNNNNNDNYNVKVVSWYSGIRKFMHKWNEFVKFVLESTLTKLNEIFKFK